MTSERLDLYAILGLTPQATPGQISRAYRALARQYHPDTRAPSDPAASARSDTALQELLAAYTVLSDPARRADYDHRGRPATHQPPRHATRGQVRVHITRTGPIPPPIQAGPVHWQPAHQPTRAAPPPGDSEDGSGWFDHQSRRSR
jgi:curved DNA-binding protein CbpA